MDSDNSVGEGRASRCLWGFMFGNVGVSGDVEAEYLDEDAREHLEFLAVQLGPSSLAGLDLAELPSSLDEQGHAGVGKIVDEDGEVDDLDVESDAGTAKAEEGHPLPHHEILPWDWSGSPNFSPVVFGPEENYDDDDGTTVETQSTWEAAPPRRSEEPAVGGFLQSVGTSGSDGYAGGFHEEHVVAEELRKGTTLPVLCVENGMEILRFSEIFGVHEPLRKSGGRRSAHINIRNESSIEIAGVADTMEDDEERFLKSACQAPSVDTRRFSPPQVLGEHGGDSCLPGQPMKERMTTDVSPGWPELYSSGFDPVAQQDWEDQIVWGCSPASSHETSRCLTSEHDSGTFTADGEVINSGNTWQLSQVEADAGGGSAALPVSGEKSANVKSMAEKQKTVGDTAARCIENLSRQNQDLLEGCWVDQIIWDPRGPTPRPKLVLDLQDRRLVFETLRQHQATTCCPTQAPSEDGVPSDGFDISNDEFYSDGVSGQLSYVKRRANYFTRVTHSAPALSLQTMEPRLSNRELANFHRPRALWYPRVNELISRMEDDLCAQGSMKIIVKSLGGKKIKLIVNIQDSVSSVKLRLLKKFGFRLPEKVRVLYTGKELEDDKTLSDQGVRPKSLLDVVMSKVHLWSDFSSSIRGSNETLLPRRAFRRKYDLSVRDGHVCLMEYCEERPLLLGNPGMAARLRTYHRKKSKLDDLAALPSQNQQDVLGSVLILDPGDESPFLGDIAPGCSQPSLENNMFRAPVFPHELSRTDYLLVRAANGMLSLRRINRLCAVGQQEPHMKVISPIARDIRNYASRRLLVYVYREFRAKQKSGQHPCIRAEDLSLLFPSLPEASLRKVLKHSANLRKMLNGHYLWVKKPNFQIPYEEGIRRILTPEDVCCYESMQAGVYRLKHLGISRLRYPVCLSSRLSETLTCIVASQIERELLLTPWNLSRSFVSCVNQSLENRHLMEINGVGDPSGCGLGFSYVRATWFNTRLNLLSTSKQKKAPVTPVGSTSDRPEIASCDQSATVRRPFSLQYAPSSKTDTTTIVSSHRTSYLLLRQEVKRKTQEVWERQNQSLSCTYVNERESSPEGGIHLDPLTIDLENFLDVEEFVEQKDSVEHRNKINGARNEQKMERHASQVQSEDENEDKETEAALISKWLDDDTTIIGGMLKLSMKHLKSLTSKDTNKNIEPQRIPLKLKWRLHLKEAHESEILDGLVKMKQKGMRVGNNLVDGRELRSKPRREFFACGTCGQLGHMKTNKDCPKYREESGALETGPVSTKSNIGADGIRLPLESSSSKVIRVEPSERSDKLQLKFKYILPDKPKILAPHCLDGWGTLENGTDTESITKQEQTSTPHDTKSEGEKENTKEESPVFLRLSTHRGVRFRPLKDVNNLDQRKHEPRMQQADGSNATKVPRYSVQQKQTNHQWSSEEASNTGKLMNYGAMAVESLRRSRRPTSFGTDGCEEAGTENRRKRKKREHVSLSSYSREYKTGRESRRMLAGFREIECRVGENSQPAKRHRSGIVLLSNILESIVHSLRADCEISYLFTKPVSKREAPGYFDIIKDPMDLSTIKEKLRKMEYKSREDFRHDIWQINFNAHRYNDVRSPAIAHLADQLLDTCDRLLNQSGAILSKAEAEIEL